MKPELFIFDLDGVLTDTAKYHFLAWKKLADELNMMFTAEDNELLKGVSRIRSFDIILEKNHSTDKFTAKEKEVLANRKNEYYKEFVETLTKDDILPGVYGFIKEAKNNGIKCAVASISKNAGRILERLEIAEEFDYIADAALVKKPKPDPEIFLTCANALGFTPDECIGIEDAQAGIESIHSAGMMSVGINVTVTSINPTISLISTSELNFIEIQNEYNKKYLQYK